MGSGSLPKTILGVAWLVGLVTGGSGATYAGGGMLSWFSRFSSSLSISE